MNQLDMQGRHAVVTGGASGLGFAMVERLLRSGAQVTVWDHDADGMAQAEAAFKQAVAGAVVHCVRVDLTQHAEVVEAAGRLAGMNRETMFASRWKSVSSAGASDRFGGIG